MRDLFYATPARLKFLKADRTETAEAADVVRRMALAHPACGFSFVTEERRLIEGVAFSVEPGIYGPAFGLRTEVDALHWRGALLVSGELQSEIELLG